MARREVGDAMKLTRRQLAASLAASAAAMAQTQPAGFAGDDEELKAARDRLKTAAAELAKAEIPMATEPAFQFKA
jgi:hypothetical protein